MGSCTQSFAQELERAKNKPTLPALELSTLKFEAPNSSSTNDRRCDADGR